MPNSIHALLDPGTWDADYQIKQNANPVGQDTNPNNGNEIPSVHRSGKSPRTFWKRIVAAWDRYWSRDLQTENRNGIEAYCQQLEAINLSMGTKARASLQSRITSGQAITLRKVKELALEEFCKQEFIDQFIMVPTHIVNASQNSMTEQQYSNTTAWFQKANEALQILKLHLGSTPAEEYMARPQKEIDALNLIETKLRENDTQLAEWSRKGKGPVHHTGHPPEHSAGAKSLSIPLDIDKSSDPQALSSNPMDDSSSFSDSEKKQVTELCQAMRKRSQSMVALVKEMEECQKKIQPGKDISIDVQGLTFSVVFSIQRSLNEKLMEANSSIFYVRATICNFGNESRSAKYVTQLFDDGCNNRLLIKDLIQYDASGQAWQHTDMELEKTKKLFQKIKDLNLQDLFPDAIWSNNEEDQYMLQCSTYNQQLIQTRDGLLSRKV